jgi:deoxyribose-phosphate aldolase
VSVAKFVENGLSILKKNSLPEVAAFCVFSNFTPLVRQLVKHTRVATACVATAFPHGQADLASKVWEVTNASIAGATDIDVVINRGMVLDGDYAAMGAEVNAFSKASNSSHLKVILEICELNLEQVYLSSKVAIENGADFIKTSTGKGVSGASLEASLVMCLAIKEHFELTGRMVGFKAAGGISSSENAMQYWNLVSHVLGGNWTNNKHFRIGASSLLTNIIKDLK